MKYKYFSQDITSNKTITDFFTLEEIEEGALVDWPFDIIARCRFTEHQDINGKDIYEGDTVEMMCDWGLWKSTITYGIDGLASFCYMGDDENYALALIDIESCKMVITGTIHEED